MGCRCNTTRYLFLFGGVFVFLCILPDVEAGLTHRYNFTNGDTIAIDSIVGRK
jgi:hypothetical protein